jgi:hypothetical protein
VALKNPDVSESQGINIGFIYGKHCKTVCCLKELARQWKEQQMPNKIG